MRVPFPMTPLVVAALTAGSATAAWAASEAAGSEAILVGQILVLVVVGRLGGEAMQRLGQPAVMGALVGGVLLGPSVFGLAWPAAQQAIFPHDAVQKGMLDGIADLGVLMLLLLAGMETDLQLVRKVGRAAIAVSAAGIAVPFACGFALGEWLPDAMIPHADQRLVTSLFLGTALSISSVKIVAMIVRDMNFTRRDVGQIILAAAVIDDSVGWIIIAVIFGLASHGTVEIGALAKSVGGTLAFLVLSLTLGRGLVFGIIRVVNDRFRSDVAVASAVLCVMLAMALITQAIGVHTVLGAFVAGILVGQSPILTRQIDEQIRGLTTALFMPVFFGLAGLGADLTVLANPTLLAVTIGLIAIASLGKFGGAFLGAALGGLTRQQAFALAFGMNARGSTEVIVASLGLSIGALSQNLYTMILAMAVLTTLVMPPTLRWSLARLPLRPEEEKRLARETFEEKGFVANLERLLLAADESAQGRFASRIAGLLAGARGMPVTSFRLANGQVAETGEERVAAGADEHRRANAQDEPAQRAVPVLSVPAEAIDERAVAGEAHKGYDLLVIGLASKADGAGSFDPGAQDVARGFDGPLAIASARGALRDAPMDAPLRILAPVTGALASRRGAEVAVALARATRTPLCALYVERASARTMRSLLLRASRDQQATLRELRRIAEHYEIEIETIVRTDIAPEDAILRQARQGRYTLIVMGVDRRPGDDLSFGVVAEAVYESADRSVLLVSGSR